MAKISDIAKALGLSNATISKALNGSPEIPQTTVDRVKECARELGYVPSHFARTLKMHRSFSIGVLFVDKSQSGLRHEYFSTILNAIKVEAESRGYDITFINSENYSGLRPTYLQHVKSRAIDGVVIASVDFNDPNVMELAQSNIPTVTIDHTFDGCTSIMSDNEDGVYELTKRAYKLGHRKIAFIHGEDTTVTRKRVAGYVRALTELGISAKDEYMPMARYHDPESVIKAFQALGKLKDMFEAKNFEELNKTTFRIKLVVIGFGGFAVLAAFLLGPEVLGLVYGLDLKPYRMNLCVIIGSYIFYAISYVNLVTLTTIRHTFVQFVVYLISMAVAFIGSTTLVRTLNLGINGATFSCTTTLAIQFIMYSIITKIIMNKEKKLI